MKNSNDRYRLSNGTMIPCIGYGTYKTPCDEVGLKAIKDAIDVGYRHIDTAAAYQNEYLVGQAIKESGLPRSDFFITSKLANPNQGYQSTLDAFERTCTDLQSDYVDLYLIHWPIPIGHKDDWKTLNQETWRAFEKLYNEGRIKAIGVSNFLIHHMENLLETAVIAPMVDQLEFHPKYQQREIVEYCRNKDILVESWGPLMRGAAFDDPTLIALSAKLGHSIAQISIRWCLQKGVLPLPKSVHRDRMTSNKEVFDFALSDEDVSLLDAMNTTTNYVFHPDKNDEWFK